MHLLSLKKNKRKNSGTLLTSLSAIAIAFLISFSSSCKKDAGEGGLATIRGKVYGYDINSAGIVTDSGYVGDVQVYISYGSHQSVDDNVRSSYTGEFAFRGLQKGKYTIYTYSKCDSCNFNQVPITQDFEITSTRQDGILADFVIYN